MLLDVFKLGRVLEGRVVPVQMPHPLVQVIVAAPDISNITFEVLHVDGIEANNGGVETDVSFRDGRRGE